MFHLDRWNVKQGGTEPLIIAHRGASACAPENTLAAFRLAIDAGADGVEFDVRLATDGVPVVIHDATLKRTAGINARVADLTSAELAGIDVGSWFNRRHPRQGDPAFASERVPQLASLLNLLSGVKALVYVELKCGRRSEPLVDAVCEVLRDSPISSRVVIKSFRLAAIAAMRERLPDLETGALFEPSITNVLRRRGNLVDLARDAGARHLSLHRSLVTAKIVRLAARANMPMAVWTVDQPRWIARAKKLGVKALITNDPARMLAERDGDNSHNI